MELESVLWSQRVKEESVLGSQSVEQESLLGSQSLYWGPKVYSQSKEPESLL